MYAVKMKNRSTIQLPREFIKELKEKKIYDRETYKDAIKRIILENEKLKRKVKKIMREKVK